MPAGIQVFNADGSVLFDMGSRLYNVLTAVTTGTTNGSINVASLGEGTPFFFKTDNSVMYTLTSETPTITVSDTTVSWTFYDPTVSNRRSVVLLVGVY